MVSMDDSRPVRSLNVIRAELADAHEAESHFLDLWDEYGAEYGNRLIEASERIGRLQTELAARRRELDEATA